MAPAEFNSHSCEYCQVIYFSPGLFEHGRERERDSDSEDEIDRRTLPNFSIDDLENGDRYGCELCRWIMDDECVTIEDAVHEGENIADDKLRKVMISLSLQVLTFSPPSPAKTLRELLVRDRKKFQNCRLFLGTEHNNFDLLQLGFFGLKDLTNNQLVCRNLHELHVHCQTGEFSPINNPLLSARFTAD